MLRAPPGTARAMRGAPEPPGGARFPHFFHPDIRAGTGPAPERPRAGPTSLRRPGDSALQEQTVTIRAKLISLMASFIAAIVLVVSFMAYYAYKDSYQIAVSGSKTTVQSVTNYVSLFFNTAEDNSAFLAGLPQTAEAAGHLPSHVGLSASKTHTRREMSPQALELDKILEQLAESSASYLAVGLGSTDGGFLEYPPIAYPAGFDPRKRPWYQSAEDSGHGRGLFRLSERGGHARVFLCAYGQGRRRDHRRLLHRGESRHAFKKHFRHGDRPHRPSDPY